MSVSKTSAKTRRVRLTTAAPTPRPARVNMVEVIEKHSAVMSAASSPIMGVFGEVEPNPRRNGA